ncbi:MULTISPECIES: hypothetical protein [Rhodococcus]|uniref:LtfC-like domain-containing protein n=1 Tax=Rhodococcus TaxID=1827 RepID=UPI002952B310|nr:MULTISPECIES: hypothetical protein [Rhodococcus]MDV7244465.1 hypothetical protein [Rhodococcus oxybenzonivorans]MDV7274292.1 hypothetical protein [Rhodococcus oxybenzonivorans]MDV7337822.1 hypothetical protein [Rhodococcus oxybenzonivorans]MDV7345242.1 hypothetical protein [Rhodococcus oxybenzonivorans]MDV8028930.1 hypothetical protein [Rhodococcus sp. IEGM 27]
MSLGWIPKVDYIFLSTGQDWIWRRTNTKGALNVGTEVSVVWDNGTTWDGVVLGDTVSFKVESTDADLIPNGMRYVMKIKYPDGDNGDEFVNFNWYEGSARR